MKRRLAPQLGGVFSAGRGRADRIEIQSLLKASQVTEHLAVIYHSLRAVHFVIGGEICVNSIRATVLNSIRGRIEIQ